MCCKRCIRVSIGLRATQATCIADDPCLLKWRKVHKPWLPQPPEGLCLNCFRDPFVLERPSTDNGHIWRIMVGAGIRDSDTGMVCAGDICHTQDVRNASGPTKVPAKAAGGFRADYPTERNAPARQAATGTALVYKSKHLLSGWVFEGHLCTARDREVDGVVWECPVMAKLPYLQTNTPAAMLQQGTSSTYQDRYLFSVSIGRSPAIYWLGQYVEGRFDINHATGPHPLDLGDLLYAPNLLTDPQGRVLLWGWLSELPNPGGLHDYAGCISLARQLQLSPEGYLHQQPVPELRQLRMEPSWTAATVTIAPGESRHIAAEVPASYFDLEVSLKPQPGSTSCTAGIVLPAWSAADTVNSRNGAAAAAASGSMTENQGAILVYDFASCQLSVIIGPGVGQEFSAAAAAPAGSSQATTASDSNNSSSDNGSQDVAAMLLARYTAAGSGSDGGASGVRQLGGQLRLSPFQPLKLRVLMDFSLLEMFTADGQTLSTRCYRGRWPTATNSSRSNILTSSIDSSISSNVAAGAAADSGYVTSGQDSSQAAAAAAEPAGSATAKGAPGGVWLLAFGSQVTAEDVGMHAMSSAWVDQAT
eukprot:GHRR01035716.1.p1 GENE.GHRR01035716.1~~GHRR01035716.1.p1  ORF type:complete len:589 (+),score=232.13 GHRR01035716.1:702-2468(+)